MVRSVSKCMGVSEWNECICQVSFGVMYVTIHFCPVDGVKNVSFVRLQFEMHANNTVAIKNLLFIMCLHLAVAMGAIFMMKIQFGTRNTLSHWRRKDEKPRSIPSFIIFCAGIYCPAYNIPLFSSLLS